MTVMKRYAVQIDSNGWAYASGENEARAMSVVAYALQKEVIQAIELPGFDDGQGLSSAMQFTRLIEREGGHDVTNMSDPLVRARSQAWVSDHPVMS